MDFLVSKFSVNRRNPQSTDKRKILLKTQRFAKRSDRVVYRETKIILQSIEDCQSRGPCSWVARETRDQRCRKNVSR